MFVVVVGSDERERERVRAESSRERMLDKIRTSTSMRMNSLYQNVSSLL